jgi:transposase
MRHKDQMPVSSPFVVIVLTDIEVQVLTRRARSTRTAHRDRLRAAIVLAAAAGNSNAAIAAQLGVCVGTVRKWRRRFAADRLAGLRDAARTGRPRRLPAGYRVQVIQLPAETGTPLSRWTCPEIARELVVLRASSSVMDRTATQWGR